MKNKFLVFPVIILSILVIVNIYWYNKRKKPGSGIINSNVTYHINLSDLQMINPDDQNEDENTENIFTYIYDISTCSGCIYNMYESIKKFSSLPNSTINVIITYDNFTEVKEYCDNYYKEYYNNVNFYYATYKQFKEMKVKYIPFLIAYKSDKAIFGFIFRKDLKPLWKISRKYFHVNL